MRIALILLSAALGLTGPAAAAPPQYPAAGTKQKIVFAMPVVPPLAVHSPVLLAREFGYLDKFNVELEQVNFEGSTRALTAAVAGRVDIGYIDCLQAYGNGVPVTVFYGPAPKLAVVLVARDTIGSIKELKGKKLGLSSAPGGFIDRMNQAVLAAAGIKPDEVTVVQTTSAGRVPALISGQTDTAVFHYEHTSKVLREQKGFHAIYDLYEALPKYHYHTLCARKEWLAKNREAVINLTAATILAIRHAYANKADTVKALVKITEQAEPDAAYAYDKLIGGCVWARNLGLDMGLLNWSLDYEYKRGDMKRLYNAQEVVDTSVANEALKRAGGAIDVPKGCF
jgi:sulfonate transport system substrate-binding protein